MIPEGYCIVESEDKAASPAGSIPLSATSHGYLCVKR